MKRKDKVWGVVGVCEREKKKGTITLLHELGDKGLSGGGGHGNPSFWGCCLTVI